jgi:hypothetical protein
MFSPSTEHSFDVYKYTDILLKLVLMLSGLVCVRIRKIFWKILQKRFHCIKFTKQLIKLGTSCDVNENYSCATGKKLFDISLEHEHINSPEKYNSISEYNNCIEVLNKILIKIKTYTLFLSNYALSRMKNYSFVSPDAHELFHCSTTKNSLILL